MFNYNKTEKKFKFSKLFKLVAPVSSNPDCNSEAGNHMEEREPEDGYTEGEKVNESIVDAQLVDVGPQKPFHKRTALRMKQSIGRVFAKIQWSEAQPASSYNPPSSKRIPGGVLKNCANGNYDTEFESVKNADRITISKFMKKEKELDAQSMNPKVQHARALYRDEQICRSDREFCTYADTVDWCFESNIKAAKKVHFDLSPSISYLHDELSSGEKITRKREARAATLGGIAATAPSGTSGEDTLLSTWESIQKRYAVDPVAMQKGISRLEKKIARENEAFARLNAATSCEESTRCLKERSINVLQPGPKDSSPEIPSNYRGNERGTGRLDDRFYAGHFECRATPHAKVKVNVFQTENISLGLIEFKDDAESGQHFHDSRIEELERSTGPEEDQLSDTSVETQRPQCCSLVKSTLDARQKDFGGWENDPQLDTSHKGSKIWRGKNKIGVKAKECLEKLTRGCVGKHHGAKGRAIRDVEHLPPSYPVSCTVTTRGSDENISQVESSPLKISTIQKCQTGYDTSRHDENAVLLQEPSKSQDTCPGDNSSSIDHFEPQPCEEALGQNLPSEIKTEHESLTCKGTQGIHNHLTLVTTCLEGICNLYGKARRKCPRLKTFWLTQKATKNRLSSSVNFVKKRRRCYGGLTEISSISTVSTRSTNDDKDCLTACSNKEEDCNHGGQCVDVGEENSKQYSSRRRGILRGRRSSDSETGSKLFAGVRTRVFERTKKFKKKVQALMSCGLSRMKCFAGCL